MEPILVDTKTLEELLMVSTHTAVKVGTDAGAKVMIGRAVRWNFSKIKQYVEQLGGNENEE